MPIANDRLKQIPGFVFLVEYRTRTRKLSYRKDDRAMRPLYGCPANFPESLSTRTATFAEIFSGLLFRSILRKCVQNLKFVVFAIPEIIGVLKKFGQSLDTPTLPFLQICSWAFVQMDPVNISAKFALQVPGSKRGRAFVASPRRLRPQCGSISHPL